MPFFNILLEGLSSEELNKFCDKSFVKEAKDKNYVTYESYVVLISEKLARMYSGGSNKNSSTTVRRRQNLQQFRSKFKSQNLVSENIGFEFCFFRGGKDSLDPT